MLTVRLEAADPPLMVSLTVFFDGFPNKQVKMAHAQALPDSPQSP